MTTRSKLLMVAYEFPPCLSAGVQRTLKFAQHLPSHGWEPVVLTTNSGAYARRDESLPVPKGLDIRRAWSFDASRRLSVSGRYLTITSTPDRYSSWYPFAVRKGRAAIRETSPSAIYSTYPVFTAHMVARTLARKSGLPWIADFRDPAPEHYEPGYEALRLASRVDRAAVEEASVLIFATGRMRELYLERYPECDPGKAIIIENGYDEDQLDALARQGRSTGPTFDILHSGAIYPRGRDITCLLEALAHEPSHTPDGRLIRLRLRGGRKSEDHEKPLDARIRQLGLEDRVHFLPPCSYADALSEMGRSDALLLLQGRLFDYQIPGKAYEYAATDRPILTLGGPRGATTARMRYMTSSVTGDMDDPVSIGAALKKLVGLTPARRDITGMSRKERTVEFAQVLESFQLAGIR
ncbi:MAG: glycosyltransferase [Planctomycetota bacterium]|nr:glycosyltransferase [Planctomycetota bacterium]